MKTALIIGASRGIGREFVQQLLADGWRVLATARDEDGLAALREAGAQAMTLDVTLPDHAASLASNIKELRLDLAIYVAGVYGTEQGALFAPTQQNFDQIMHANVLGAMQLTPVLAPLLEATAGKMVFISSSMGSIDATQSSAGWSYRVSKAALNMAVKAASFDYPGAVLIAMDPGWVRTDMGGPNATLSVQQSVSGMRKVIASLTQSDSGTYRNHAGRHLAW